MKFLKSHHRKTIEDGMTVSFFWGNDDIYSINCVKVQHITKYNISIQKWNECGYCWFEDVADFYSWDNVKKYFEDKK